MKRLTLIIIMMMALLGVLAACGGEAATPTPTNTAAPAPTATEEIAEPTAEPEAETEMETAVTNAVTVADQSLGSGNTVTIDQIIADVDGWIVIHAQADGGPGPIVGFAPVAAGDNSGVSVEIDPATATVTLYAMLHVDAGTAGEFEFPGGDDGPARDADGNVVTPPFALTIPNAVSVADQSLSPDNTVTIAEVVSATPGWLVIHAQTDGSPGPILGHAPVSAGYNQDVVVEIDTTAATETIYAMLHVDAGAAGEFEFPGGDDGPATDADGNVVTPPFTLTGGLPEAALINLGQSDELGAYLTDSAGMTLYTFANDTIGTSNCYDQCANAWPPLLLAEGETAVAELPGELSTTTRDDGTEQVTYDGWPLYYWINDEAPGDTTGHLFRNVWAVARPAPKVLLGGNEELGRFLTGPDGFTLYRFNADEPGQSSCYDQCAANWPPLLLEEDEALTGGAGVVGALGTIERDDGTIQVTYGGMPLYYWANDEGPGDATGQGVNDVWFVVPPLTVRTSSNEALGDFLVGANGMTLYFFTVDDENSSNCYDQCAANWPPLVVQPGEVPIGGVNASGELGTTERDDGTIQVTYNGMPLYYWVNDEAPGDTTGQGVNDVWFVVAP